MQVSLEEYIENEKLELINQLRDISSELGETPRLIVWRGKCTGDFTKYWDTYREFYKEAGLEPLRHRCIPKKAELCQALKKINDELGRTPTIDDWECDCVLKQNKTNAYWRVLFGMLNNGKDSLIKHTANPRERNISMARYAYKDYLLNVDDKDTNVDTNDGGGYDITMFSHRFNMECRPIINDYLVPRQNSIWYDFLYEAGISSWTKEELIEMGIDYYNKTSCRSELDRTKFVDWKIGLPHLAIRDEFGSWQNFMKEVSAKINKEENELPLYLNDNSKKLFIEELNEVKGLVVKLTSKIEILEAKLEGRT